MVLMEVMMIMFFFKFYLNLAYHVRFTPKSSKNFLLNPQLFSCNLCTSIALTSIHCKIGNLLLVNSMLNLTSHGGTISYKVILNGYLPRRIVGSVSRLFPPILVHGSRPSCSGYHKLSRHVIGPLDLVLKINDNT
ncbi:hypothetical protein AMTRI_Chr07g26170 [Amborella trichopoda]